MNHCEYTDVIILHGYMETRLQRLNVPVLQHIQNYRHQNSHINFLIIPFFIRKKTQNISKVNIYFICVKLTYNQAKCLLIMQLICRYKTNVSIYNLYSVCVALLSYILVTTKFAVIFIHANTFLTLQNQTQHCPMIIGLKLIFFDDYAFWEILFIKMLWNDIPLFINIRCTQINKILNSKHKDLYNSHDTQLQNHIKQAY